MGSYISDPRGYLDPYYDYERKMREREYAQMAQLAASQMANVPNRQITGLLGNSDKADTGRREKACPVCERIFVRDTKKYSHQQWADKVFCSNACANSKPLAERLVNGSIVCAESGCWNWQTALDKDGYGRIVVTRNRVRRYLRAHRAAYAEWVSPIPADQVVMHSCDNPSCINPNHLSVGSQRANNDDKMTKGRGANQYGPYRGGGNATAS